MRVTLCRLVKVVSVVTFVLVTNVLMTIFMHSDGRYERGKVAGFPKFRSRGTRDREGEQAEGLPSVSVNTQRKIASLVQRERIDEGSFAGSPGQPQAHRQTELSDIFISVKTTQKFHQSRVGVLLETWVTLARSVVSGIYFNCTVIWLPSEMATSSLF